MKTLKRLAALALAAALALSLCCAGALAKGGTAGQAVDTVLFYVRNSRGEEILVSHFTVAGMEADLAEGRIDAANHNYSLLDGYVTPVHQEAQGLTVPEFVDYARSKSTLDSLRELPLTFSGEDEIAVWEIDQTGFDERDTYSYHDLYGAERYNFPLLYEYWDYRTQDYCDPAGRLSREEVIDYLLENGEPETFLLSVRAFSQRYIATGEKYGTGDYNMEDLWLNSGVMDTDRAIRLMKPMTEEELRSRTPTVSATRYWVANLRLDMADAPDITSLGCVAAPTASMTEDADNYYITFGCATSGATILYNSNYANPGYTPSRACTGSAVAVPKSAFPDGTVTMTCRAVKDGYTDAGVVMLTLTPGGAGEENTFADVNAGDWYCDAVSFVARNGLFNGTSDTSFSPDDTMTRAMLVTVLHRYAGRPASSDSAAFADVAAGGWYAAAVDWAAERGYVNGTGDQRFSPDLAIPLEQIVTVLWRYAGSPAAEAPVPGEYGPVSSWASGAMSWAAGSGLLDGVGGTLSAREAVTRAQVAAILMNFAG